MTMNVIKRTVRRQPTLRANTADLRLIQIITVSVIEQTLKWMAE